MRLYHEREQERGGTLDTRDEEECFTSLGRKIGVFLTTEELRGPLALSADVEVEVVEEFEVTTADGKHREFVVPGAVVNGLGFATVVAS
ncbi:MAG: hypothetical protein H0W25_21590 [Acidimicrobiia bacterium]|nr:hypothetical protein [Acidimicrobiia bacterium]